jgi:uncharacterized protein (DUF1778 family)
MRELKTENVRARFTKEEKELLDRVAKLRNLSKTDTIITLLKEAENGLSIKRATKGSSSRD